MSTIENHYHNEIKQFYNKLVCTIIKLTMKKKKNNGKLNVNKLTIGISETTISITDPLWELLSTQSRFD